MAAARPTVVALQPGYLPWLGYFDQMQRADVFVVYDDVQYDTHGWRNRNRIKTQHGPRWLTVPVRHRGLGKPCLLDVSIDSRVSWARKHVTSMRQAYARAPYVDDHLPVIEEILTRAWNSLVDLNLTLANALAGMLGIHTTVVRASELDIPGKRTERVIRICRHFGARTYLSGNAAQAYLDVSFFEAQGIAVEWQNFSHPTYPQQHGDFVPFLSAVDLLFNCGPHSRQVLHGAAAAPRA